MTDEEYLTLWRARPASIPALLAAMESAVWQLARRFEFLSGLDAAGLANDARMRAVAAFDEFDPDRDRASLFPFVYQRMRWHLMAVTKVKVSAANKMAEVKAVPLDARQEGLLRKLIHRGLQFVVPAMQRRQAAKKARGEQIGRPIGGWFAVEWALAEFRKTGMQPLPEVVKGLKREFEGR